MSKDQSSFPQTGIARFKSALSGDTVILRGKSNSSHPPEALFTISNIIAPHLSGKNQAIEQPYSFESREFLRTLLVGKEVQFKIEYSATNTRHFGVLSIQHPYDDNTDVGRIIMKNGWAKVKLGDSKRAITAEQEVLQSFEKLAQSQETGIWNLTVNPPRIVKTTFTADAQSLIASYASVPIHAIIEQVRDGSSMRALLFLNGEYQFINLNISGIKAPTYRKDVPNVEDLVEPFGEEAKYFTESRLLQRDVKVVLESVAGQGSSVVFYATIIHPAGNIAELLLTQGFAKVLDWNVNIVKDAENYKAFEQRAKSQKLRIWKYLVNTKDTISNDFFATVIKILGPDILLIALISDPLVERKIQFSSIRGPKRQKNDAGFEIGYYPQAVEFLRNRLIGCKVLIKIDYVKPAEGEYEKRDCASIFKNSVNVGVALIESGCAAVIKHRKDDDCRSAFYDLLIMAEEIALKSEKGIHSHKDIPIHRVVDASANHAKSKSYLAQFQRTHIIRGVVDFVSSASRFKISIPSQSCRITFVLGGIKTPRATIDGSASEPYGVEAAKFTSQKTFQRDVEIVISSTDKGGSFIGTLFFKVSGIKKNLGLLLLENGLATIHDYSASQSEYYLKLCEAENLAKDGRKNIWKDYDALKLEKLGQELVLDSKPTTSEISVSEVLLSGTIYVQKLGSVVHVVAVNSYTVLYIDYGNSEIAPGSRLRPLPPQFANTVSCAKAQEAKLAYVHLADHDSGFDQIAYSQLCALIRDTKLISTCLSKIDGCESIVLQKNSNSISINEQMVRLGLAYVSRSNILAMERDQRGKTVNLKIESVDYSELRSLVEAQDAARKARLNIWQYGDFMQDEDI